MGIPLAHSEKTVKYKDRVDVFPSQSYAQHIRNVVQHARAAFENIRPYLPQDVAEFLEAVIIIAAEYHDLGKLLPENQAELANPTMEHLPRPHSHVGEAMLRNGTTKQEIYASMMIGCHHTGYYDVDYLDKKNFLSRSLKQNIRLTPQELEYCRSEHRKIFPEPFCRPRNFEQPPRIVPILMRIALGCLSFADGTDTEAHYTADRYKRFKNTVRELLPKARLENLKRKLTEKHGHQIETAQEADDLLNRICTEQNQINLSAETLKDHRINLRKLVSFYAEQEEITNGIYEVNYPVGTGKTIAIMRMLLANAAKRVPVPRHIIYVSPFVTINAQTHDQLKKDVLLDTSIIDQNMDVFSDIMTLSDEKEHEVIGRHDHRSEYKYVNWRKFAAKWNSTITITTAVQLFETLSSKRPSTLSKLINLPGSMIFIDEYQSCWKLGMTEISLAWLKQLCQIAGCSVILSSGSAERYWDATMPGGTSRFMHDPQIKKINISPKLESAFRKNELNRVNTYSLDSQVVWSMNHLIERITAERKPAIVVMNTILKASYLADQLSQRPGYCPRTQQDASKTIVYHLSTALCGHDRNEIIKEIADKLKQNPNANIVLVATSCVEAGVDLSFRTGFREIGKMSSLEQIRGRVNRGYEYHRGYLYYFRLSADSGFHDLPVISRDIDITIDLMERAKDRKRKKQSLIPMYELTNEATHRRIQVMSAFEQSVKADLFAAESRLQFETVDDLYHLIDANEITVVTNEEMVRQLEDGDIPHINDLQKYLVRLDATKGERMNVEQINIPFIDDVDLDDRRTRNSMWDNLYKFPDGTYNSFVGYMRPLLDAQ